MTFPAARDLSTARPGQPVARVNNNRNNASLPRAGD